MWAPDGRRIAALIYGGGRTGVAILDAGGRVLRRWELDALDWQLADPAWSPDGRRVALSAWHAGSRDLYLLDPATGALTALWRDAAFDAFPAWSPDGRWLAYAAADGSTTELWAFRLADRRRFRLTRLGAAVAEPAFSPDGRRLAFSRMGPEGWSICLMDFMPPHGRSAGEFVGAPLQPLRGAAGPPAPLPPSHALPFQPVAGGWFPFFGRDDRGPALTAYDFWQDRLARTSGHLALGIGLGSGRPSGSFGFHQDDVRPAWSLSLASEPAESGLFLPERRWATLWQWRRGAAWWLRLPPLRGTTLEGGRVEGDQVQVGVRATEVTDYALVDREVRRDYAHHPAAPNTPDEGVFGSAFLQFQRADARWLSRDAYPTDGQMSTAGLELGGGGLDGGGLDGGEPGGLHPTLRVWLDHRRYVPLPAPAPWFRHALALRGVAGWVEGRGGDAFYAYGPSPFGYQPLGVGTRWELPAATGLDNRYVLVRGYPYLSATRVLAGGLEYRFPLLELQRGQGALPFYVQRLHGALYGDLAGFWNGAVPLAEDWRPAVGAELRAQSLLGLSLPADLRLGVARGLGLGGELQWSWGLGSTF